MTASASVPAAPAGARSSLLHVVDARTKLVALAVLVAATFAASSLAGQAVVLLAVAGGLAWARTPGADVARALRPLALLFVAIVIFQGALGAGQSVAVAGSITVESGYAQAAVRSMQVTTIVLASFLLTSTTAPVQIAAALRALLSPLRQLRVPVDDMSLMMAIGLSFVPTMTAELERLQLAQRARGADVAGLGLAMRVRLRAALLVPLVVLAFRRAHALAEAMRIRGYVRGGTRSSYAEPRIGGGDVALFAGACLIAALAVIA